jgi:putative ABC transport system ATP-binding protein
VLALWTLQPEHPMSYPPYPAPPPAADPAGEPAVAPPSAPAVAPVPEIAIQLEGVSKTYGKGDVAVHALRDVSLAIPAGQFVVVLGPSGSGKTTLMNIVGGIEPATSGRVIVDGQELAGLDDGALTAYRRSRVGFVFQFFNLIPTLTARENVSLVAELVGNGAAEASGALEAVGLDSRADRFPSSLSGGEQQRVAIARAIVKLPPILLCDEPTGSLDLETGRQILSVLHRLAREGRRTVILVTHNSAIAAMADRVVRLGSGAIVDDVPQPWPIAPEAVTW